MNRFRKFSLALIFSLVALTVPALAAPPFDEGWLEQLRQEAIQKGVGEKTAREVLRNLKPMDKFPSREEQPEFRPKDTLNDYLRPRLTENNISKGAAFMRQYGADLREIEKSYGVPAPYIMAIWAIETHFGANTGSEDVITSLVTLARDHPNRDKRDEFRRYVIAALKLIDKGYAEVLGKGSWAGAMGQPQFMPPNVEKFGVDLNGDGKVDIWNDRREIFASIANYLKHIRPGGEWQPHQRWGREVRVPKGLNEALFTHKLTNQILKTPREWGKLGIKQVDGTTLPDEDTMQAILIAPDGASGRTFLVYGNFKAIMGYNSTYKYALAVSMLADAIATRTAAPATPAPRMN